MPRKKGTVPRVHTGIRLDAKIVERLSEGGRGLSEEIRERLERTLEWDTYDEPTRDLASAIMRLAAEVEEETGQAWHGHSGAHLALRQAILSRLARVKPKEGPITFGDRPHQSGPGDDPQTIGQWAEYQVWETRGWSAEARKRLRTESEKSWREIVRLQKQREQEGDKS